MNVKEQFLLELVRCLALSYGWMPPSPIGDVQFVSPAFDHSDVDIGDVVICLTSARDEIHPWMVSIVDAIDRESDSWKLRNISTGEIATITNERFVKIVGMEIPQPNPNASE